MSTNSPHAWRFFCAGGFNQVKLETGADLMNLDQLDQKLWVALACPTTGLEFDPKTAALIDTDKDGRMRAPEIIAATKWAGSMLKNPSDLVKGDDSLPLSAINDSIPEGKQLLASAKQILVNLGKADATAISLADASDANKIFINTTLNGDGIIIAESASDEATKAVINDIAACLGTVADRSGKPGIDQAKADAFFTEVLAFSDWNKKAEAEAANILPAGDATAAAAAAVRAIKTKVDDFFGRCRLAAFDPRTVALLNRKEEEYVAIAAKDMSISATEVAGFPLAQVAAGKALPLKSGINPAHAAAVAALYANAVKPLLGDKSELTEADWTALLAKLGAFECWNAGKAGAAVEKLGLKRVREILGGKAKETIAALIAKDKALEPEATSIANVEKLCRFVRDLYTLCINFVNFRDLYDGGEPAIFQCGTLYLDQRSCTLCLTVEDAGKHASMAGLAGAYLAYCDCVRRGSGEKKSIVAIFSQGDDDNLMVGRNGVFYDRKGRDYDATITKIVSNPISLRQAFWAPYKKLVRMIDEQIAKRAAAAEGDATAKLAKAAEAAANVDKTKKEEPKKVDVGAVAAMGVAFGALSAALAGILGLFKGIAPWQFPLFLMVLMLVISGPSLILAYMKLRRRNLGPILDANGWAVNAKAKVNVPFGTSLTGIAKLPPGSTVDVSDRYAEKSAAWPKLLVILFAIWWVYAFASDMGILWRLTKNWETPLGNPPAALSNPHANKSGTAVADKASTETPAAPAAPAK
ncbi:MAG: hypothetical protein IT579_03365 [Verrucomicrobia subdivision 3 bacterium]|nr:hypothetical protein [Limisphaerales bacterium]